MSKDSEAKYIVILERNDVKLRYFNFITDVDFVDMDLPHGISVISEKQVGYYKKYRDHKLMSLGLVSDGLVPVFFNPDDVTGSIPKVTDNDNKAMAVMLAISGYCSRYIKRSWKIDLALEIANERLDHIQIQCISHFKVLRSFEKMEKYRESAFILPSELMAEWHNIHSSAQVLMKMSDDIERLIGPVDLD